MTETLLQQDNPFPLAPPGSAGDLAELLRDLRRTVDAGDAPEVLVLAGILLGAIELPSPTGQAA